MNKESGAALLRRELIQYEKQTPMNGEEREALHEWVASGNSVHSNSMGAVYDGGRPLDFLTVYRETAELADRTRGMTADDARHYAAAHGYFGMSESDLTERRPMTRDELICAVRRRDQELLVLDRYLWEKGLVDEARDYVEKHWDDEKVPFQFDGMKEGATK